MLSSTILLAVTAFTPPSLPDVSYGAAHHVPRPSARPTVCLCIDAVMVDIRFCRRQGLPGLPRCAGVPVRRACRTGTVPLAVELIEGHGAGGEREPGRDARMPPGSRTGLRDGRAAGCLRTPGDPGPGGGRQPGIIE